MEHAFNVTVATDFDVNTAIFLQNLKFWTLHNLAHKHNIRKGRAWAYYTLEALTILFPYWTIDKVRTMLKNAIKNGLVIKDNFNEKKYDRTCWYALTDKAYKYFPELTTPHFLQVLNLTTSMNTDLVNFPNGFVKNPTPIPDTIPDTKKKTPIVPKGTILFNSFWDMYPTKKGKKKAFNIWKRAKLDTHADVIMEKLKIQIESDESWKSGYIPHPTTYLAGERWEDELTLPKPKTPAIQGSNPVVVTEKSPEIVFNTFFQDFLNLIKMKLIPSDAAQPTYKEWLHEGYGESATAYAKKHNLMQVVRVDRSV